MNELLPPLSLLTTFLAASFVLAVTSEPGVLYVLYTVTRSLAQDRRDRDWFQLQELRLAT